MKPVLEPPKSNLAHSSLVAFERKAGIYPWNWHYHPEMELTLIRKGEGMRLVGDHSERYQANDLVLLGANLPHTWFTLDEAAPLVFNRHQAIVIQFRPPIFPDALLALPEFEAIRNLLAESARGIRFPHATAKKVAAAMHALLGRNGVSLWLGLADLLGNLAQSPRYYLASPSYHHGRSYKLSTRLDRIITHVEKEFREEISIAQMAKIAGLTPGAFSRFFRKMTHQTFVSYRNSRRVREACRLLTESDLSVTEIAYECGFNNLAHFNRQFLRDKKMVPKDYRRLHNPE